MTEFHKILLTQLVRSQNGTISFADKIIIKNVSKEVVEAFLKRFNLNLLEQISFN